LHVLEHGGVVGIFPEGPFSVRGRLEPGLPGVALLAIRSGVPVVPAGIRGTFEALRGRRFYIPRRHPLSVRFGAPRRFTGPGDTPGRDARQRVTERIMADIAALLS
jgi:1-acyl-sn-glycerol-3-phosphate acyltransferase